MSTMYIRVKKDGTIYPYDAILAKNPGCEVLPEELVYPERFVKPEVVEKVKKTRAKRKTNLSETLVTEEPEEAPEYRNLDIDVDASRKLP